VEGEKWRWEGREGDLDTESEEGEGGVVRKKDNEVWGW
jgi:hypothetical protein